jgi:hypothetical protein
LHRGEGAVASPPIDLAPVADTDHDYEEHLVEDGVDDPVIPDAQAQITLSSLEGLHAARAWVRGQSVDPGLDSLTVALRNRLDVADGGGLELDGVGHSLQAEILLDLLPGDGPRFFHCLAGGVEIHAVLDLLKEDQIRDGDDGGHILAAPMEERSLHFVGGSVHHLGELFASFAR